LKIAIFAIILGLTGQQLLSYGVAASDPANVNKSAKVAKANDYEISSLGNAGVDSTRNKSLPLIAVFAGSFMLICSVSLFVYLLLALRRHQMAPASGIFYDSHFYHGVTPTDNFDERIRSQMSLHPYTATDEILSSISNPRLPEPGTSIIPHNVSNNDLDK
jgi:hypothetical protein